jgi:hypothetical protein
VGPVPPTAMPRTPSAAPFAPNAGDSPLLARLTPRLAGCPELTHAASFPQISQVRALQLGRPADKTATHCGDGVRRRRGVQLGRSGAAARTGVLRTGRPWAAPPRSGTAERREDRVDHPASSRILAVSRRVSGTTEGDAAVTHHSPAARRSPAAAAPAVGAFISSSALCCAGCAGPPLIARQLSAATASAAIGRTMAGRMAFT